MELSDSPTSVGEADNDGNWLAVETHKDLICVNLSTGKLDAASGKTLWKRRFTGERIVFWKLRDKFALAQWQGNLQKGKGKLVLLNPHTGKQKAKQPMDWQEFLNWEERLRSYHRDLEKTFLTDEQRGLRAMWICEKHWQTPDGMTIIILLPNGKLAAYSASQ